VGITASTQDLVRDSEEVGLQRRIRIDLGAAWAPREAGVLTTELERIGRTALFCEAFWEEFCEPFWDAFWEGRSKGMPFWDMVVRGDLRSQIWSWIVEIVQVVYALLRNYTM
jgi:hypothetical protein